MNKLTKILVDCWLKSRGKEKRDQCSKELFKDCEL